MASKLFLLLGLAFAIALLISSEVTANDLAPHASATSKDDLGVAEGASGVKDAKYGRDGYLGGGYNDGGYLGDGYDRGVYGRRGGYGGYGGFGGGCRYGYCPLIGSCCRYAGELETEAEIEAQPQP